MNFNPCSPIGIFDSGVGGLTVAKEISKLLPYSSIIYFGDIAHLPYGEKSANSIKNYAKRITSFLIKKKVRAIVIACNSASSYAIDTVKNTAVSIPVFNVIDPVINYIKNNGNKKETIGIIGTKATISSGIYEKKIKKINPEIICKSMATPLLAPMIEESLAGTSLSKNILNFYFSKQEMQNINSLILACTHYPLIEKDINEIFNNKIKVLNSAKLVALELYEYFKNKNCIKSKANHKFYVSEYTSYFEKIAKNFFGQNISLIEYPIWNESNEQKFCSKTFFESDIV